MLAAIGLVLYIVAGILKLVDKHLDWLWWLVIIGGGLVAIDVVLGRPWTHYRRAP
jgi:hypothetical protein